jgi:hypothetical protein
MTTAQESTNGHRVLPLPGSFPDSQQETQSENSTNNNFNSIPVSPTLSTDAFPANAYHVPPSRYAPKAYAYRRDDTLNLPPETAPLPERCQFMFSDGRQCTMARSEIHPSLCPYHSEREDQLFGTPSSGGSVVGAGFDLPELYSACRDLTTAAGVSRALAQVFRLLAQRRISRQEAATFAKLGHLLLQSISAARSESMPADNDQTNQSLPDARMPPPELPSHKNGNSARQSVPPSVSSSASPRPAAASSQQVADCNSSGMNTSAAPACNSREISTYENIELKPLQNEHLHKSVAGVATCAKHSNSGEVSRRR